MPFCNTTLEDKEVSRQDLAIGITFHHLGLILSAAAGLIAVLIAEYLIFQHALHYSKPMEQKHIIRILFMIPVYAVVSFLSYLNYKHAIYYEVLRDCYEAFAIASFFTLLCNYIAPSLHEQKDYFRASKPKNWLWPVTWCQKCSGGRDRGLLRQPASGLTSFNLIYLGVFQYCFIRVFFTIIAVSTQAAGRYCEASLSPAFAHIWILVFEGLSVTFAMYALIQFYYQTKEALAPYRPFLKLLCIKLVIFFCFWQTLLISFLSSAHGPLQPTPKLAYPDIQTGIPSMLICLEMAMFAVLHLFAFPWRKPYGPDSDIPGPRGQYNDPPYFGGRFGWKAFAEAFNPWDILKATARGAKWLFVGVRRRRQDPSHPKYEGSKGGWDGGDAFDGPDANDAVGYGRAAQNESTGLQDFGKPKRFNTIPLNGGQPRYSGPHQDRHMASRLQSQDEDAWDDTGDPFDDRYGGLARQGRGSYELNAGANTGLLRNPAGLGTGRTGISPARSDIEMSPERSRGRDDGGAFDKETGINEQYNEYGRHSWGRDHSAHGA